MHYDPIIIDLSTGEMILTATYGDKLMKENSGCPTTAAFSSDGRYFYYMLYGNTAEYRTALYRYDLQQDTTELCYSGSNYNYCPHLSETIGGDFLVICDSMNGHESQEITQISYENGTWTGKDFMFDLISEYCRTNCLLYSSNSGYAVVPMRFNTLYQKIVFFQRIQPDNNFFGLNQYHCISKEDNQIQTLTADECRALAESLSSKDGSISIDDFPYGIISKAVLSPDGNYVLLLVLEDSVFEDNPLVLYLVRLEDLALKEVQGIEISPWINNSSAYPPIIEWNTDTLIIYDGKEIAPYKFQLQ